MVNSIRNSKKAAEIGVNFLIYMLIALIVFFVVFGLIRTSSGSVTGFFKCESHEGVLSKTCDEKFSKIFYGFGREVDGVRMKCCVSNGFDDTAWDEFLGSDSEIKIQDYGVSGVFGKSPWKIPDNQFQYNNNIYVRYNDNTEMFNKEHISNFNNGKFKLEFANGWKEGKYCTIRVWDASKAPKKLTSLTKEWADCTDTKGVAVMLRDFKGTLGYTYEIDFIVREKKASPDIASAKIFIDMKEVTTTPGNEDEEQIIYSFDELNYKFYTFFRLNTNYCVAQPTDYLLNPSKELRHDGCSEYPVLYGTMLIEEFKFYEPMPLYNQYNFKYNFCLYLRKNETHFSTGRLINYEEYGCDKVVVIKPFDPVAHTDNFGCAKKQGDAMACLSLSNRDANFKFNKDTQERCYWDGSICKDCSDGLIPFCEFYENQESCDFNDCVTNAKCYWDRAGGNKCLTCKTDMKCSDYSDDPLDCDMNACKVRGGCRHTTGSWWTGECVPA